MNPDKSKWILEEAGAPLQAVLAFIRWIEGLPWFIDAGEALTTAASWPRWREQVTEGTLRQRQTDLAHFSTLVRYPAEAMAYVLAPVLHPDQDEPIVFAEPTELYSYIFTLLLEGGAWRVHSIGPLVAPDDVGKVAYSW